MTNWIGAFDSTGTPTLMIRVSVPPFGFSEIEAIIDTGFTGFLLLPFSNAGDLQGEFEDVKFVTLGDGTRVIRLQHPVTVTIEGEEVRGIAIIEPDGKEAILGMKFLRGANRGLHVFPGKGEVLLIEDVPNQ